MSTCRTGTGDAYTAAATAAIVLFCSAYRAGEADASYAVRCFRRGIGTSTARTTTAYMYVSAKSKPAPSGTYTGTVTDWNYSSVTLWVANTVSCTVPWGKCDVDGDLYVGAPASVSWKPKPSARWL